MELYDSTVHVYTYIHTYIHIMHWYVILCLIHITMLTV